MDVGLFFVVFNSSALSVADTVVPVVGEAVAHVGAIGEVVVVVVVSTGAAVLVVRTPSWYI